MQLICQLHHLSWQKTLYMFSNFQTITFFLYSLLNFLKSHRYAYCCGEIVTLWQLSTVSYLLEQQIIIILKKTKNLHIQSSAIKKQEGSTFLNDHKSIWQLTRTFIIMLFGIGEEK